MLARRAGTPLAACSPQMPWARIMLAVVTVTVTCARRPAARAETRAPLRQEGPAVPRSPAALAPAGE